MQYVMSLLSLPLGMLLALFGIIMLGRTIVDAMPIAFSAVWREIGSGGHDLYQCLRDTLPGVLPDRNCPVLLEMRVNGGTTKLLRLLGTGELIGLSTMTESFDHE